METPYLCPSEGHKYGHCDVRDTIWKLEHEHLNEIFGSVLPENRFVLQITTQFAAGSENGGDMSSVTSE